MSATLRYREVGGIVIIDVVGRITYGEGSSQLRDGIKELHSVKGKNKIILNMEGVTYIDPSGLGELVSAFTALSNLQGNLKLFALTARVKELLMITQLFTVFEVFETEELAVASFQ